MGYNIIPTENDKMNSTLFAHNFVISYALWLNQVTVETAGGATKAIPVDGCPANKYVHGVRRRVRKAILMWLYTVGGKEDVDVILHMIWSGVKMKIMRVNIFFCCCWHNPKVGATFTFTFSLLIDTSSPT